MNLQNQICGNLKNTFGKKENAFIRNGILYSILKDIVNDKGEIAVSSQKYGIEYYSPE